MTALAKPGSGGNLKKLLTEKNVSVYQSQHQEHNRSHDALKASKKRAFKVKQHRFSETDLEKILTLLIFNGHK